MGSGSVCSPTPVRAAILALAFTVLSFPLFAQRPPAQGGGPPSLASMNSPAFDLDIAVRDAHGGTIESGAVVHLYSAVLSYDVISPTSASSAAHFSGLMPGEYQIEVTCPGFQRATEQLIMEFGHQSLPIYIYLVPEADPHSATAPAKGNVLPQELRPDMQKGMEALAKDRYDAAQKIFTKLVKKAPANPDVIYYLGVAELGLQHTDLARADFQHALSLDPDHELALVSLGVLQLRSGDAQGAITSLEKAVSLGRAGWRACYQLAIAYAKANRLSDAETAASRAVKLAKGQAGAATFLLGQIQYAQGKQADAKSTWESVVTTYPSDPSAATAKKALTLMEAQMTAKTSSADASLAVPKLPEPKAPPVAEHAWAPPDTDNVAYDVARDVTCQTNTILDAALQRMKTQLLDFEKFTATEHIEHTDIDRYGWPGAAKSRDYSYIVFVHPLGENSLYVEESRAGKDKESGFPDAITTTSLNSMGVNVLQPFYRDRFNYSCEGLANVRAQAAWQIRFAEKPEAKGEGVRRWQLNELTFEVPIKGRIWISSASFAVLRVETDLREPVKELQLTKDHLLVDYGPVSFAGGRKQLWLPWSADMYMEFRGKRYHHRHSLSDYLLFDVHTADRPNAPKEPEQ